MAKQCCRTGRSCPLQYFRALQSGDRGQGVRGRPVIRPEQAHAGARLVCLGQDAANEIAQVGCLCLRRNGRVSVCERELSYDW